MAGMGEKALAHSEKVFEAWKRARTRSICQSLGVDPDDPTVPEGAWYIRRPHEMLPYEITEIVARGRVLAKRFGW